MAHIHPTGWQEMAVTGSAAREIETLGYLDQRLAHDPYRIYHGVHWTNVENGFSAYGEIDFIIVAPNGRVLLIEQKAGFLSETPEGLVKNFEGKPRRVANHIMRSIRGLKERFGGELSIDYLLYCPDYIVRDPHLAGLDPRHIIDAGSKERLAHMIREILPIHDPKPDEQFDKVTRFLGNMLSIRPDPSSMIGNAAQMVTRLSGGLATWARRLEFSPFRLRVIGTAGSGKTQLALAEYAAAIDAHQSPLYVCYNRPLADHISTLVPAGGRVATFHMLSDAFLRDQGHTPDYASPTVWTDIETMMSTAALPPAWKYDVLIVDEGQDFSPAWRDILLRMLKEEGRAIWLEDPNQNLYGRPEVPLPGWVKLHSDTNFRSPRQIVDMLASIGAVSPPVEAGSPFKGADIEELLYPEGDTEAMLAQTRKAITMCLGAGFARHDIAIASFRGREKSAILHLDKLSEAHTLRSFTGDYDLFGTPIYREGGLLAESVYRFKGQSAPAVIFTEIDFEQINELVLRKLFVGMTRARLKLVLVLSERAEQQLLDRM
ncbi:ATP-binding domain-containing protein [Massilia sp. PAMC28688]|uniref:ATP-binding domain-containing protein n=1 Tax=Massilia sp. PAMC28688 TaxID=2861283 RepID=UPI001C62F478|nr:ATP-binding domain-containing protein [Massilia sp. PAMC28688]QYF95194.1 ATP-binding domain-containing protein [Massilia sp. PAMC28688]